MKFVSILLIFLLLGCKQSAEPKPVNNTTAYDTWYPLEVGNYWIYIITGSSQDTTKKVYVKDTITFGGNLYYLVEEHNFDNIHKKSKIDTLYLRFPTQDILHWYKNSKDSLYIDFTKFVPSIPGTPIPGYKLKYPSFDSTFLGSFDSCMEVYYGGNEESYGYHLSKIGELERIGLGVLYPYQLIAAKIGDSLIHK